MREASIFYRLAAAIALLAGHRLARLGRSAVIGTLLATAWATTGSSDRSLETEMMKDMVPKGRHTSRA